jgi:tricarballylate dehydrogenase
VLVNAAGERFVDEARGPIDAWYERTTRDIAAQTGGVAWVVLDQQALSVPNIRSGIRTEVPPVVAGTIEELAAGIGAPADALARTLSAYNAACGEGEFSPMAPDGLATSGITPPKSNWARPVNEGPFEAYPIMAANVFTFGGIETTAAAEVVDNDGRVVRGLWAAGEMTGLYYSNYTGSTSVLRGATFGRIAGREAAGG